MVLWKLNLQMELYGELRPVLKYNFKRTRLNFQTTPTNVVMWNLEIKILYILGHTDNDKERLQHPNSKSDLRLRNFGEVYLGNNQLSGSNKLTV